MSSAPRDRQYSLRRLFAITTAAAVVAGVFSQLPLRFAVLGPILALAIYLASVVRRWRMPEYLIQAGRVLRVAVGLTIVGFLLGIVLGEIWRR